MPEEIIKKKKRGGEWIVGVLVLAIIGGAFFIGRLSAQVEYLSKGVVAKTGTEVAAGMGTVAGDQQQVEGADLSIDNLKKMAGDLGVDGGKFDSCLDEGKFAQRVADDRAYGNTVGVSGTPTFYVNGIEMVGAQPLTEFVKVVDAELKDGSGDKAISGGERKKVESGVGPVRGSADAKIKVIEFSDFQCPFCTQAYPTVKALEQKYGDKLSVEYRQYPLSFHPYAQKAAEASECVRDLNGDGKFWEFYDKVFGGQTG